METDANNTSLPFGDDGPQYLIDKANEEASEFCLYLAIAELLPCTLATLLSGFVSDVTGKRKFQMWLPCLGIGLNALCFALPLYINEGDIDEPVTVALLVIGCVLHGASSSKSGFYTGSATYIAYTDSEERRTLRFAQVECIASLTYGISNLVYGFWVDATGDYLQPLWFIAVCSAVPFVLILLVLKEPLLGTEGFKDPIKSLKGVRNVTGCTTISQRHVWAIYWAFQIYVFIQQGQERVYVLFLSEDPFYWDSIQIGLFFFILYVGAGLGSYPGIPILLHVMGEALIVTLAVICKLLSSIILAFAKGDVPVYICKYLLWLLIYLHEPILKLLDHFQNPTILASRLVWRLSSCTTAAAIQVLMVVPFTIIKSAVSRLTPPDKQGTGNSRTRACIISYAKQIISRDVWSDVMV